MLHYNRWDCDSLRSLYKFGLAKNPALYLRFWSLYSKLHSRRLPCLIEKKVGLRLASLAA